MLVVYLIGSDREYIRSIGVACKCKLNATTHTHKTKVQHFSNSNVRYCVQFVCHRLRRTDPWTQNGLYVEHAQTNQSFAIRSIRIATTNAIILSTKRFGHRELCTHRKNNDVRRCTCSSCRRPSPSRAPPQTPTPLGVHAVVIGIVGV